jgi:hypothetical protein
MELRKLISKFLTNLFEKKYAEANKDLQTIVEAKVKRKIEKTAKNLNLDTEVKKKTSDKKSSNKKLSKKEQFLKNIGKSKKVTKKGKK